MQNISDEEKIEFLEEYDYMAVNYSYLTWDLEVLGWGYSKEEARKKAEENMEHDLPVEIVKITDVDRESDDFQIETGV